MYKNFAEIYDVFMEYCDYEGWKKQVSDILKKYKKNGDTLLEIGCGTGNMLLKMSNNYRCVGFDISNEMLEVAKRKLEGKKISLYKEDMRDFELNEKFDVIVSIFDTVNHLLNMEELVNHFKCVKKHLMDDGVYIFDVVDRNFMKEMFPNENFVDVRDNLTVIWEHEIYEGIDYIDAVYFMENDQGLYKKFQESYEKKIFTFTEIETAIKKAGLKFLGKFENDKIAGKRYFYAISL